MKLVLRSSIALAVAGAALVAACSSKTSNARGDSAAGNGVAAPGQAVAQADTAKSMQGMPGMQNGQMGTMTGTMDSMQTHMRMMDSMGAGMKSMVPAHRQMVANMLSQLNGEMRKMNMTPDVKWTALTDSIRQDLVRIPDMTGSELRSFMPQHGARVMRLMEMHRAMMSGMK